MSTFDYSRFVKMGIRMLTKYGVDTTITVQERVVNPDEPWNEDTLTNVPYPGLLSAKFDAIKAVDKTGQPLKADATFYVSMKNATFVDIPYNSQLVQSSEPERIWSVVKAECIKPAETGCLWIVWVEKYA